MNDNNKIEIYIAGQGQVNSRGQNYSIIGKAKALPNIAMDIGTIYYWNDRSIEIRLNSSVAYTPEHINEINDFIKNLQKT